MKSVLLAVVLVSLIAAPYLAATPPQAEAAADYYKGITYYSTGAYDWNTTTMRSTIDRFAQVGTKWLALVDYYWQDSIDSTNIYFDGQHSHTDADIKAVVDYAHAKGIKVLMKPHIDVKASGQYRWQIGKNFGESQWAAWFASYKTFITRYADLSKSLGVEMFTVGTELDATDGRTAEWRSIVAQVRSRYAGPLTYAANTGRLPNIQWWDAVDMLGVDAYYVLTSSYNPTVDQLIAAWAPHKQTLAALSAKWGKRILFTEVGYTSSDGANTKPWNSVGGLDKQEQVDCYEAAFRAIANEPWFAGFFWWAVAPWETWGTNSISWNPLGQPAEQVLVKYYAQAAPPAPAPTATPTTAPTATAVKTATPAPTATAVKTATPAPTATAVKTATPAPTTTAPTPTSVPGVTSTPAPTATAVPATTPPPPSAVAMTGYKGITYYSTSYRDWNTSKMRSTIDRFAQDGVKWLALSDYQWQDSTWSTRMYYDPYRSHTDAEIKTVVDYAHSKGIKVLLKPHVESKTAGQNRASIGAGFDNSQWATWFASYKTMMTRYADLSKNLGIDMLAVGTELDSADTRTADWRALVAHVRTRYAGPLTYAANTSRMGNIAWWDAVDMIGVSAFYSLTSNTNATVDELVAGWAPHEQILSALSAKWGKQILFTGIGYTTSNGSAGKPWTNAGPLDKQEQANAYEASFRALSGEPWFAGFFWWAVAPWETWGTNSITWNPLGQPAEQVLLKYYK